MSVTYNHLTRAQPVRDHGQRREIPSTLGQIRVKPRPILSKYSTRKTHKHRIITSYIALHNIQYIFTTYTTCQHRKSNIVYVARKLLRRHNSRSVVARTSCHVTIRDFFVTQPINILTGCKTMCCVCIFQHHGYTTHLSLVGWAVGKFFRRRPNKKFYHYLKTK